MSRIHHALTRAGQAHPEPPPGTRAPSPLKSRIAPRDAGRKSFEFPPAALRLGRASPQHALAGLPDRVREIPWTPNPECHVIDIERLTESPTEEFRSLRTRLNHLKGQQALSTLLVTSPSPSEGKSFTACNLAVVQSHLQDNFTLLCDFDFRRPLLHGVFGAERAPGLTDYLEGRAALHDVIRRVAGTNLFLAPAGEPAPNPLELLNLPKARVLFEQLPSVFPWVILDSPPLLFAADANLLSTMTDGTLLVVRLGHTTVESLRRAIQSMSRNNVIGMVANGARRGELYSKYAHYHSYSAEPKPNGVGPG